MITICNASSVDDVKNTFRLSEEKMSIPELEDEIKYEREHRNRKSVISMLDGAIKRKVKESKKKYYVAEASILEGPDGPIVAHNGGVETTREAIEETLDDLFQDSKNTDEEKEALKVKFFKALKDGTPVTAKDKTYMFR